MVKDKREWIRYLHEYISQYQDGRASQLRDLLYRDDREIELLNCEHIYKNFDDAYPDIMSLKEFLRESKLDKILN